AVLLATLAAAACFVSAGAEEAAEPARPTARASTAAPAAAGAGCLTSVVLTAGGSTTVCPTMGCTAGTVTESHDAEVAAALQWGFRSFAGGHIKPIAGETGAAYLIRGTDFPGSGTYRLV